MIIFFFKAELHETFASSVGRVANADREIFPTVAGMPPMVHFEVDGWITSTPR
jgi:hypothetical protein